MGIYPPSEDTFLLLNVAAKEVKKDDFVLEVGTGSGIIAEEMKKKAKRVIATDVNPDSVKESMSRGVSSIRANLFDPLDSKFDLVLFNPPYLPSIEEEYPIEKAVAGGKKGRETSEKFIENLERVLAKNGRALLVVSDRSGIDPLKKKATEKGFRLEVLDDKKLFFERLVVFKLQFP